MQPLEKKTLAAAYLFNIGPKMPVCQTGPCFSDIDIRSKAGTI